MEENTVLKGNQTIEFEENSTIGEPRRPVSASRHERRAKTAQARKQINKLLKKNNGKLARKIARRELMNALKGIRKTEGDSEGGRK